MARMDDDESSIGKKIGLGAAVLLLGVAVYFTITTLNSGQSQAPKQIVPPVVQIKMLPPPPPPPPPPKEPPPPEPQKVVDTPKMETPLKVEHTPSPPRLNAPPAGPIGSDAHGNGPSAGEGGGSGGSGDGMGGDGTLQGWFAGVVQTALYQAVNGDERINGAEGQAVVNICLADDGTASQVTILTPFPDAAANRALKEDILRQLRLSDPPPKDLPHSSCVKFRMRLQSSEN